MMLLLYIHPAEEGRYLYAFQPAFIVYGALYSARELFRTNQVYQKPNARGQARQTAGAQRTLFAVACTTHALPGSPHGRTGRKAQAVCD
jgi:hypothetical protein